MYAEQNCPWKFTHVRSRGSVLKRTLAKFLPMRDLMKWNIALAHLSNFIESFLPVLTKTTFSSITRSSGFLKKPAEILVTVPNHS